MILEDISNFKPLNNLVLVKIHSYVEDKIDFNGTQLQITTKMPTDLEHSSRQMVAELIEAYKRSGYKDKKVKAEMIRAMAKTMQKEESLGEVSDNTHKQAVRRGVVAAISNKVIDRNGWDFTCDHDIQVGDEVWFDSFYTFEQINRDAEVDDKIIECQGEKYLLLPSQAIHAGKRGGEIIAHNGYILGEKESADRMIGSFLFPDNNVVKVKVTAVSERKANYVADVWRNNEVKVGDTVYIEPHFAIRLDSTIAESTSLVRFQDRVVLAIQ